MVVDAEGRSYFVAAVSNKRPGNGLFGGAAIFNGAPGADPYTPHAIPATNDGWQPSDAVAWERAADERLEVLREERRIVIPFGG
jgi:hypothetical protein